MFSFLDPLGAPSVWAFCHSVSLKEDVNEPLASQEREGGVGLREADGGLLGRRPHTQPPVQCCWCLEPGTMVCVCTAGCGDAHLLSRHIGFCFFLSEMSELFESLFFFKVFVKVPPFVSRKD